MWFRDYVYIPLGGNRCSKGRQILNMLVVWALTGFWHGANWNFLCWGLYYFVLLVIEKYLLRGVLQKGRGWQRVYTLFFVVLGWGIFTANAAGAPLGLLMSRLFLPQGGVSPLYFLRNYGVLLLLGCLFSTSLPGWLWEKTRRILPLRLLLFAGVMLLSIAFVVASTGSTALYADF